MCAYNYYFYYTQGNNDEQPASGELFVSLHDLNSTYPPRTAMASGSSPRPGSPVSQGWAHVCLHFLYNYLRPISIFYEEIIGDYLRGIIFFFVFL